MLFIRLTFNVQTQSRLLDFNLQNNYLNNNNFLHVYMRNVLLKFTPNLYSIYISNFVFCYKFSLIKIYLYVASKILEIE